MLRFGLIVLLAVSVYCVDHRRIAAASHCSRSHCMGKGVSPSQRYDSQAHLTMRGAKCPQTYRWPTSRKCPRASKVRCGCDAGYMNNELGVCTHRRTMQLQSRRPHNNRFHLFAKGRRTRRSPDPHIPSSLGRPQRRRPYRARVPVRLGLLRRVPTSVHLKRLPPLLTLHRPPLLPILHRK